MRICCQHAKWLRYYYGYVTHGEILHNDNISHGEKYQNVDNVRSFFKFHPDLIIPHTLK